MNAAPITPTLEALVASFWELHASAQPQATSTFETALRDVVARDGEVTIRDGHFESDAGRWQVAVTLSASKAPADSGDRPFDVHLAGERAAEPPPVASTPPSAEFLHGLAHELRTPLSALQLWIKVLTEGDEELTPSVRDGLEVIRQCADEQQALIAGLVARAMPAESVAVGK